MPMTRSAGLQMHMDEMARHPQYVIVYGTLSDGAQGVIGPFGTEAEAEEHLESRSLGHFDKFVTQLEPLD